jgi:diguanylate cyclase (GGDEF)-like protein
MWPLLAALIAALLWSFTLHKLDQERDMARQAAFKQAHALANSYADQLRYIVEQIDQLTLSQKFEWEDPSTVVSLEKQRARGLYPESSLLFASILNGNGDIVTSTITTRPRVNMSDKDFFQEHKRGCCSGLLINKPEIGMRIGRPIIRFSRKLDNPDGSFGGVAVIAVEPAYLASFQDESLHGTDDFVSVWLADGTQLASRKGSVPQPEMHFTTAPRFSIAAGVAREPEDKFIDKLPRIVAWKKLAKYPLVATAALAERDAFAAYEAAAQSQRDMVAIASLLLIAFPLAAMYFSSRLAWRRYREEEIKAAYRLATDDAANEGFYTIRPLYDAGGSVIDFRMEDCNHRGAALVGEERANLVGRKISDLQPDGYSQEMFALCRRAFATGLYEDEVRVSPPSILRAAWVYRRLVRSGDGLALAIRDISEAKAHELSNLANADALTQLPNRHWLADFLPSAIKRARSGNGHLAVLFIDLDNFKNINDTLGHDAGDELLKQAATRLKSSVRCTDHVIRLGGDEFTVILEQIDQVEDVSRIARLIVHTLSAPFMLSTANGSRVNASIGISLFPQDGIDGESLLKHADIAMYAAKAAGKGRFHFYQSHLSDTLILKLDKERALRQAVEQDEFVVHYQPRVGANSGKLSSMEALVRWMPLDLGIVYPADFIDLAEDSGMIVRLGELVIEKVCAQLAQWQTAGQALVPVSINVSPLQLKQGNVSSFLANCLATHGIDPRLIEMELTESAVIDRSQIVLNELANMRARGIKLLSTNFGSGYSSLAQLHRIDVDVLKVDQGFTQALSDGAEGEILFRAIVSMADALDMSVVAEGVETAEQLRVLQELSCDEIQGHFHLEGSECGRHAGSDAPAFSVFDCTAGATGLSGESHACFTVSRRQADHRWYLQAWASITILKPLSWNRCATCLRSSKTLAFRPKIVNNLNANYSHLHKRNVPGRP